MKVLFAHPSPFLLAHGGCQIQIEQTKSALESVGVQTDYLRWWDDRQTGDLIHHFGIASNGFLDQAKTVRLPVVMTTLFTETCNRSDAQLTRQGWLVRAALKVPFGEGIKQQLNWRSFNKCTRNVVGLKAEALVLQNVYRVPRSKISVVPLGLSSAYLSAGAGNRGESHLICTGTIVERKNSIPLAEMAHAARVPILFVGKPYHSADPYWLKFKRLIDGQWVKYHEHVNGEAEMIALLKSARGFVLMSSFENWCLSAHEAAACGLPLLVQSQKWSRERFGSQAAYFSSVGNTQRNTETLKQFHADAPRLASPNFQLHSWRDVAFEMKSIYEEILKSQENYQ